MSSSFCRVAVALWLAATTACGGADNGEVDGGGSAVDAAFPWDDGLGADARSDSGVDHDAGDDAAFDAASDAADPNGDTDGDGLPDAWEIAADDPDLLDWNQWDSDGNGVDDGDEDYDGDGLTNLEELAAARLTSVPAGVVPDPFRVDILVELDAMAGCDLPDGVLEEASAAYADLPTAGVSGRVGVGLIFYRDEEEIPAVELADNDALRGFLVDHGPSFTDAEDPPIPYDQMVHVASVTLRTGTPDTPATTVFVTGGGDIEETGAAVFVDAIESTHPACAGDITVELAEAAGLIHEIGHLLQLGHDTDVGGGIDHYNIMSLAANCFEASERYFGTGNDDESLGATEAVGGSRFSWAAADLMQFDYKLSVDTSVMVDTDGVEM